MGGSRQASMGEQRLLQLLTLLASVYSCGPFPLVARGIINLCARPPPLPRTLLPAIMATR